jgi:5,10-methylenetetrahydrofolate reductase
MHLKVRFILILAFIANCFGTLPANAQLLLPAPGVMVHLSPAYQPPALKGIKVNLKDPFQFDFVLDKGDTHLSDQALKEESSKLIKYFLASLTTPEGDLWVNLSPYEKDRIVPESFGQTEMGRDLLVQDYLLKQITASLIYPEDEIGKKFWKRIYEEAAKKYGSTAVPVNTFNKVWIVPEKAVVYENAKAGTAYVVESRLKVMLEEDYQALQKNVSTKASSLGSDIVREVVIPELTKEVNEGTNFAQLRQVYQSLILAAWYKKKIKNSILSQVYADQNKTAGVAIDDPQEKQKIYEQYLQAFKKGVYNYIKDEQDSVTQEPISRKYFSGGATFGLIDEAMSTTKTMPILLNKAIQIRVAITALPSQAMVTEKLDAPRKLTISIEQAGSLTPDQMNALIKLGVSQTTIADIPVSARFLFLKYMAAAILSKSGVLSVDEDLYQFYLHHSMRGIYKRFVKPKDAFLFAQGMFNPVIHIANNARTKKVLRDRIIRAANLPDNKGILLITGSGLIQRMFGSDDPLFPWPVSVLETIKLAADLKTTGEISKETPIFVAWNPNNPKDTPERLMQKINAGANGVITQPPFLWDDFEKSLKKLEKDLPANIPILVGVPVFASAYNLRFWLKELNGIDWRKNAELEDLVRYFEHNQRTFSHNGFKQFRIQWSRNLIQRIQNELPRVTGIHISAIGQEALITDVLSQAMLADEVKKLIGDLQNDYKISIKYDEKSLIEKEDRLKVFYNALLAVKEARSKVLTDPQKPFSIYMDWWGTYKNHSQSDIAIRHYGQEFKGQFELSCNLFDFQGKSDGDLTKLFEKRLHAALMGSYEEGVRLDPDFVPHSQSISWQWNRAFWSHVEEFMKAQGKNYRDSIGGSPDTNPKLLEYTVPKFFSQLEEAIKNNGEGKPFYYIESGVASTDHPKAFLKKLREHAKAVGKEEYLQHFHYVVTDFTRKILDDSYKEMGSEYEGVTIEYQKVEGENPLGALEQYRGRILCYHATNVFDSIPTDQIVKRNGKYFEVFARLYLPQKDFDALVLKYGDVANMFKKMNHINQFVLQIADSDVFYHFWQDVWNALKFDEMYMPINDIERYSFLGDESSGQTLKAVLDSYEGDYKMFLGNHSIKAIREIRQLIHAEGNIEVLDLMVNQVKEYGALRWEMMPKYDGSQMFPINWALLKEVIRKDTPEVPAEIKSLKEEFGEKVAARAIVEVYSSNAAMTASHRRMLNRAQIRRQQEARILRRLPKGVKITASELHEKLLKLPGNEGLDIHVIYRDFRQEPIKTLAKGRLDFHKPRTEAENRRNNEIKILQGVPKGQKITIPEMYSRLIHMKGNENIDIDSVYHDVYFDKRIGKNPKLRIDKTKAPNSVMVANGGIDLNSIDQNLQTKENGEIKFAIDPAMLEELRNAPGFVPVIINIQPLTDLPTFLTTAAN